MRNIDGTHQGVWEWGMSMGMGMGYEYGVVAQSRP